MGQTKELVTVTPFLTPDKDEDPMLVFRISGDLQERFDAIPYDDHVESKIEACHEENRAMARYIETAVNCHADLLAALEGVIHHNNGTKSEYQLPDSLIRHIESAIQKAKGAL